ncbi:MAG: TIGR02281 family clan AA aspartic protease [Sphingobium sp.]
MNISDQAHIIWYVLALVLVGSALISRRFSLRSSLAMVLGWIAIFFIVLALFTYRQHFVDIARDVGQELTGAARQRADGDNLHISMGPDGHFWVDGEINGTSARFLIDSGATITALSDDVARNAGLNVDDDGPGMAMQTANGTVLARRSMIAGLAIGPIHTADLPIVVSDRFNGVNVLGMNFLSRLKGWRVEDGEMILEP